MSVVPSNYEAVTRELHTAYPTDIATQELVGTNRVSASDILSGKQPGLFVVEGPCALTDDIEIITSESESAAELELTVPGIVVGRRLPPWKPRTNPDAWFGEETTNPQGAYCAVACQAKEYGNLALELAVMAQADRYAGIASFAWFGGRNDDLDTKIAIAKKYPELPLAVKNNLAGDIEATIQEVNLIAAARRGRGAPVVMIYRGGKNARTPREWSEQYKQALQLTAGRLIVDTAHGGEMAHDVAGKYEKSVIGQIICMEHVICLAEAGCVPKGIMMEASDAPSPTDPTMPLERAHDGIRRLARVATPSLVTSKV